MSMFRLLRSTWGVLIAALVLALALAACNSSPLSPTPTNLTPDATLSPETTSTPTPEPTLAPDRPISLTLWAPTWFDPGADTQAGRILDQQLQTFALSADGVPSVMLPKKEHGPGGLFDLLRAASPVAPGILPDVIVLDTTDLDAAARAGLLQPISDLVPTDPITDAFAFARDLTTVNDVTYGIVFAADIEHLAYNSKIIDDAPAAWSGVLTSTQRYVFALHGTGTGVSDDVLAQYFALNGSVTDSEGRPILDPAALTDLGDLYLQAQREDIFPANILDLAGPDDAWDDFVASNAAMVNVVASRYLSVSQSMPNLQFSALPALDQPTYPIARGWALAIVTKEPRRQAAAMRLILWLTSPDRSGAWTQAAGLLPSRASALNLWDPSQPYVQFLLAQLSVARAAPSSSVMSSVGPVLRKFVDDVLANRATPADAAQAAVTTLSGGNK